MPDIEPFMTDASEHGDEVDFAAESDQKWNECRSHEAAPYGEWRTTISFVLPVVWAGGEGEQEDDQGGRQQKRKDSYRWCTNESVEP